MLATLTLLAAAGSMALSLVGLATVQAQNTGAAPAPAPAAPVAGGVQPNDAVAPAGRTYPAQPLVRDLFFADPSARAFNGSLYVYASHDVDAGIPDDDLCKQYAMHDYRVLSMDRPGGKVTVGPVALDVKNVPWASKQMWAPDAAQKNGTYFLYFPARDKQGVFRIGVATCRSPTGPFTPEAQPIRGSYAIDPSVFTDDDGRSYLYFCGIWGGQLQRWATGRFDPNAGDTDLKQDDRPALAPKVAPLTGDMKQFAPPPPPRDAMILDPAVKPLLG